MVKLKREFLVTTILIYSVVIILLLLVVLLFLEDGLWQVVVACGLFIGVSWLLYAPSIGFPPAFVLADEETFPTLNGLIDRVAAEIDVPTPPVILTAGRECMLGVIGLRQRPILILSQPLLQHISAQDKIALIAHELGHLRDDAFTRGVVHRIAYGVLIRGMRLVARLPFGQTLRKPLCQFRQSIDRIRCLDCYKAELLADWWAVQVAGSVAARQMIQRYADGFNSHTHPASQRRLKAVDALPHTLPALKLTDQQHNDLRSELCHWPAVMREREAHMLRRDEEAFSQSLQTQETLVRML